MEENYYNAKEVAKLLKISVPTVYRKARAGDIPFTGKRPNLRFPKEAINILAEVNLQDEEPGLTFTLSTIADAWTKQEITRQPYGEEDAVPFKTILEVRKRNDEISMNVKLGNRILGWVTFLPLEENIILDLIHGQIKEKDIPPQAIKRWSEPYLSVYIPVMEVIPSSNAQRDKEIGAYLLKRSIKWAITLTIQHDIKNWYAIGATPEGQAILESLGFEQIASLGNGQKQGYRIETRARPVRIISLFLEKMDAQKALAEKSLTRKKPQI
ncbi:MAG: helix-turn-helix domain-containing protein [Ktedonobacteraceae bacterium]|nr:helix-turn-helix domain-containing protein [Ktedonobacteraceae bacterium]